MRVTCSVGRAHESTQNHSDTEAREGTYEIYRNRDKKMLELKPRMRKCKFLYHYWIDDFAKAQTIMDRMHKINWPRMLDVVARRLNPAHGRMFRGLGMSYYWSAFQTEWATDTAFTSPDALARIYPQLVRGAIATFGSRDVLRFLGKRPDRRYQGEVPFCVSKRRSTTPARFSRIVRARAIPKARSLGVRCARAWPTCTAAPRCRGSRTTVTPTPWLRWIPRRRSASWPPVYTRPNRPARPSVAESPQGSPTVFVSFGRTV